MKDKFNILGNMRIHPEEGAIYIELALTLPLLFFLSLWSIDINRSLATSTQLSTISREAGNNAFKLCRDDVYPSSPGRNGVAEKSYDQVLWCLNYARSTSINWGDIVGFANLPEDTIRDIKTSILSDDNLEIIISLYTCDNHTCSGSCDLGSFDNSCSCRCDGLRKVASVQTPRARESLSRYDTQKLQSSYQRSLDRHGELIVAEAMYNYEGLTPLLGSMRLYESSVF
jgi:hypothetical protein